MQPSTPSHNSNYKLNFSDPLTAYSRDQEDKEVKIAALTAKVKSLQKQIAERVRGFLIQSNGKGKKIGKMMQDGVQTDLSLLQSNQKSGYSSPTAYDLSFTPSHSEGANVPDLATEEFKVETVNLDLEKSKTYVIKGLLADQKRSQNIQQISQFQIGSNEVQSPNKQAVQRQQFYRKERKKLMKEIKALRQRVKFQSQVSTYAKEALLLSEEQNYQFRLHLRALKEQLELSKPKQQLTYHMLPSENELQIENKIFAQQNKFLRQKIHQLQESIYKLKEEINSKQNFVQSLLHIFGMGVTSQKQNQKLKNQFEKLKETVFQISNCVPLKEEHDDSLLFRPESVAEMILSLQRVRQYCSSIGHWQNEKHLQLAAERQRVVSLLEFVAGSLGTSGRAVVAYQIRKTTAYRCYLPIFEASRSLEPELEETQCLQKMDMCQ